jgi:uncharacterized protein (TIGR03067 family)
MVAYLLPILLAVCGDEPPTPRPSESDLKQARQLIMGVWQLDSIVDNGETLGSMLIKRKVAEGGKVSVGERMIQFDNPVTGDTLVTAYRIDPTTEPRRIDVINNYDRLLRGIYRFEGDQLVVCLQHQEDGPRPTKFEAPERSNLVLLRMSLADPNPPADSAPTPKPAVAVAPHAFHAINSGPATETPVGPQVVDTPATHVRAAKLRQDVIEPADPPRKATDDEIKRAHELLYGTWTIRYAERDGESLGEEMIRTKVARDGRIVFGNRTIVMASPRTGDKVVSSFRLDPITSPREIDVITEFDNVKRGIYKYENDELYICLNEADESERPTDFAAPPGSKNLYVRLRPVERPPVVEAVKPAPVQVAPVQTVTVQPSPEELARQREERVRKSLVGSWTLTDQKGTLVTVLEPDGAFVATRTWKRATKRLFFGQTTTSRGRWTYNNGWIRVDIYSSNDPLLVGRSYYQHVDSVGASSLVGETMLGQVVSWQKLR